jgi:hypothetical protein
MVRARIKIKVRARVRVRNRKVKWGKEKGTEWPGSGLGLGSYIHATYIYIFLHFSLSRFIVLSDIVKYVCSCSANTGFIAIRSRRRQQPGCWAVGEGEEERGGVRPCHYGSSFVVSLFQHMTQHNTTQHKT